MRALRTTLASACLVGLAPAFALAAPAAALPSAQDLLRLPADAGLGSITKSPAPRRPWPRARSNSVDQRQRVGNVRLRAPRWPGEDALPDGRQLDGNGKLDQWSYYQDGFEVYREDRRQQRPIHR